MANLVRTAKGKLIDLNQLINDNQKATALGNGHMNARGDIIKNGKVVKTVEEQRKEYEEANERTNVTRTVSVSSAEKLDKFLESEVEELKVSTEPKKEKKETKSKSKVEGLSLTDILN